MCRLSILTKAREENIMKESKRDLLGRLFSLYKVIKRTRFLEISLRQRSLPTMKRVFNFMILAHKIELIPTKEQVVYFLKASGTSRFVYNWCLQEWNKQYSEGKKPSAYNLKKEFNAIKYENYPWLKEIHRDAHSKPFEDVNSAFQKFFKKTSRYPQFKKRTHGRSFYVSNDKFSVDRFTVKLPKIGVIKIAEELRFSGKITSAVVSQDTDRWFISISVDIPDYHKSRTSNEIVGIDLGIHSALTLSTGEKFSAPKPLKRYLKKLQRLSRQHSRKQKGSENKKKSALRLARLHRKIKCIRSDFIHKIITQVCSKSHIIVLEDLAVRNMVKNHKLARSLIDVSFGEIKRQFVYKAKIYGNRLIFADRFFPSSKACSNCGNVKDTLLLSEREYCCEECGYVQDRDINASLNLRTLGLRGSYDCGERSSGMRTESCETTLCEAVTFKL